MGARIDAHSRDRSTTAVKCAASAGDVCQNIAAGDGVRVKKNGRALPTEQRGKQRLENFIKSCLQKIKESTKRSARQQRRPTSLGNRRIGKPKSRASARPPPITESTNVESLVWKLMREIVCMTIRFEITKIYYQPAKSTNTNDPDNCKHAAGCFTMPW